jgi:hypothetical protein
MRLFEKLRKQPTVSEAEVTEIKERVRSMRREIGRHDIELADLFALLGEDERPLLREIREVSVPQITRVWPDEVPELPRTPAEAGVPKTTYGDWDLMRRKGLVTLP